MHTINMPLASIVEQVEKWVYDDDEPGVEDNGEDVMSLTEELTALTTLINDPSTLTDIWGKWVSGSNTATPEDTLEYYMYNIGWVERDQDTDLHETVVNRVFPIISTELYGNAFDDDTPMVWGDLTVKNGHIIIELEKC